MRQFPRSLSAGIKQDIKGSEKGTGEKGKQPFFIGAMVHGHVRRNIGASFRGRFPQGY